MNNLRSNEITNATYLAQQRIDNLRTLLSNELSIYPAVSDEQIDLNGDGTIDFRRITQVTSSISYYNVRILIFPAKELNTAQAQLIATPELYQVKARVNTMIYR